MAEQDVKENEMTTVSSVDYVRGLKGKDSVLVSPENLMKQCHVYHRKISLSPGEQYELPYESGLIMIQVTSSVHQKAIALVYGNNTGNIIVSQGRVNFFSEVENYICIFNTGVNKKYVVKNTIKDIASIALTFIS